MYVHWCIQLRYFRAIRYWSVLTACDGHLSTTYKTRGPFKISFYLSVTRSPDVRFYNYQVHSESPEWWLQRSWLWSCWWLSKLGWRAWDGWGGGFEGVGWGVWGGWERGSNLLTPQNKQQKTLMTNHSSTTVVFTRTRTHACTRTHARI